MRFKMMTTCFVFLILGLGGLYAQKSIVASGGEATGVGGTSSYSIGQVVYTAHIGPNGNIANGVQQPYEISFTSVNETKFTISSAVFPNPTIDILILDIKDYNNEKLSYRLFDIYGKLIMGGHVRSSKTTINTANLTPAIYFIDLVNHENIKLQSFKIIKN